MVCIPMKVGVKFKHCNKKGWAISRTINAAGAHVNSDTERSRRKEELVLAGNTPARD
jgi:hypothetical protein